MKPGIVIITVLTLALTGAFALPALAASSTTSQIILDASDGTVNGQYTAAQVRAALAAVNNDASYSQYSDVAGVLQAYLVTLNSTGSNSGSGTGGAGTPPTATVTPSVKLGAGKLDYTGGQPLAAFALGGVLLVAGVALRWRWN